jgi:hypothetical protein
VNAKNDLKNAAELMLVIEKRLLDQCSLVEARKHQLLEEQVMAYLLSQSTFHNDAHSVLSEELEDSGLPLDSYAALAAPAPTSPTSSSPTPPSKNLASTSPDDTPR